MFCVVELCVCVFKQKTAYEVRISDWISDGCASDLPGRNRPADKMVHAYLAVEQGQPPEPQQGQAIGIDRFADDLGDEVIGSPHPQRSQPKAEDIMGEQPVYRRLLCAGMT